MRLPPVLFALLLAFAPGCRAPFAPMRTWGEQESGAAVGILHRDYRLPAPPDCALQVSRTEIKGPGHFTLAVRGSGWRLDDPLEPLAAQTREGPGETVFTWDLSLAAVTRDDAAMYADQLLLHLSRGKDHRALVIPRRATRGRAEEPGYGPGFPTLFLDTAMRPPAAGPGRSAGLPGPDAPPSLPAAMAPLRTALDRDSQGGVALRIGFDYPAGTLRPPPTLEELRGGFGCFQPELAAGIIREPGDPAGFRVPLGPGDLDEGRPFLLLLRSAVPGEPSSALWAIYYPRGGAWTKAFCLFRGPWVPGPE